MLNHEMADPVNYWTLGAAIFAVIFMLQYALLGDFRAAIIYSLVIAGAIIIFHRLLNRSVHEHNKL